MPLPLGRIRERRQQLGLSQAELAERVGLDQRQISQFENGQGNPTTATLISLAKTLDTSIDWIVGMTNNMGKTPENANDLDDLEREAVTILRSKSPSRRKALIEILRLAE